MVLKALRGVVWKVENNMVLLDVSGLIFEVFVISEELEQLKKKMEKEVLLWCSVAYQLPPKVFGSYRRECVELFEKLLSVSGVGFKAAYSILNLGFSVVLEALERGEWSVIAQAKGVGKKTAQVLVARLKGKLDFKVDELVDVLVGMGVAAIEAWEVAKSVKGGSLEERVKEALRLLAEKRELVK